MGNMRLRMIFVGATLSLLLVACGGEERSPYAAYFEDLPFEMEVLVPPTFPDRQVDLRDAGGKGDGQFLNTQAFERAMQELAGQGGGTLYVPAGVWHTGPIVFRSNIRLYLEKGAVILFSRDKSLYPLVETVFEGLDTRRCQSPISGRQLENIAIVGHGAIDGAGDEWRPVKREKVTESQWRSFVSRGGVFKRDNYWFPSAGALHGDTISNMNVPQHLTTEEEWLAVKDFLRPVMVSFIACKNVFLQGVIFSNSPSWNLHPLMCENVIIDGIQVRNPSYAQNGDGLDLESCRNALVVNSSFDVGDDGICIKSGKDEDGRRRARVTENVIVENCVVYRGHGGFVVGSEMSGGVRNILVRSCSFLGTDVGLRFKSRRGRGGVVENIFVENVSMHDISTDSFRFNLYYGGKSASEALAAGEDGAVAERDLLPVTEETPMFRNLSFKNVTSVNARRAMYFHGLPEMPISNINLENVTISARYGAEFMEVDGLQMKNVRVFPQEGEAFLFAQVKNLVEK